MAYRIIIQNSNLEASIVEITWENSVTDRMIILKCIFKKIAYACVNGTEQQALVKTVVTLWAFKSREMFTLAVQILASEGELCSHDFTT
jgi:hypothetical protein